MPLLLARTLGVEPSSTNPLISQGTVAQTITSTAKLALKASLEATLHKPSTTLTLTSTLRKTTPLSLKRLPLRYKI